MPQVIQGAANAATLAGVDDVYVLIQPPSSAALPGAQTNTVGFTGSSSWGPLNTTLTIGSGTDLVTQFGPPTTAAFDMPTDVYIALQSGANNIKAVRVSDGTDTAAVIKMNDSTGFATDPLTVAGAFSAGVPLSVTLTPVTGTAVVVNYTTQTSDATLTGVASSLNAAINNSNAVTGANAFLKTATVVGVGITLTALVSGAAQNTVGVVTTGVGVTVTAGSATLLTGATPGTLASLTAKYTGSYPNNATNPSQIQVVAGSTSTTTSPTYKLVITFPNSVPEVYDNVVAYATAGAGYAATTLIANIVNAINGTPALNQLRPASSFYIAVSGASTATPLLGTLQGVATNGTDGANPTTGQALGSDAAIPKTGMYALSGQIAGGQFCLSGNTDLANSGSPAIAFALRENALAVMSFPKGTSTNTNVANKALYGLSSPSAIVLQDFIEFTDSVNNITARSVAGSPFALALLATTSPETSPANRRTSVITGTSRTGAVQNQPYSPAELQLLEQNGINLFTLTPPGGNYPALRHNKNSLGSADPARGNIAYSTMTKFLAASLSSTVLGQFIGQGQSRQPGDKLREKVRATVNDFLERLRNSNIIDSQYTQCDLKNNTVNGIASGLLNVACTVGYMSIVDRLVISLTGGQTVKVTTVPGQLTAQS